MATTMNALNINTQNVVGFNYPDIQAGSNTIISRLNGTMTIASTGGGGGGGDLLASNNLGDVLSAPASQNNLVKNSINVLTSATSLTAADCGKAFYCTGVNSYTVTLPDPSTVENQFIEFSCQMTNNPSLEDFNYLVLNSAGTLAKIAGQVVISLTTGDSVRLVSFGGNWWIDKMNLQPVNFLVNMTGIPALPATTITKLPYNHIVRDTAEGYDITDSQYYLPVPGLYEFYHCSVLSSGDFGGEYVEFSIVDTQTTPVLRYLTSQQAPFASQYIRGAVSSKKDEFFTNINSKIAIYGYQSTGDPINLDIDHSFFGGRRVSLF